MKKIRTLIVDDEPLARDRLRQLLQDEPEIEIAGECADGREAVARRRTLELVAERGQRCMVVGPQGILQRGDALGQLADETFDQV